MLQEFLKHDGICTVKSHGGCRLCARITNLLNIHARACRVENCKVPHCLELREQMRYVTQLPLRCGFALIPADISTHLLYFGF